MLDVIQVSNKDELSSVASKIIIDKVNQPSKTTIGFATGGTPLGTYQKLIEDHQLNKTSYRHVVTFNLDEYVGISSENPTSYRYYMEENLFKYINIKEENIHLPNGTATNLDKECKRYEKAIQDAGGIDLQILGIGRNGHIGFNEPDTPFDTRTHIVTLTESTRVANSRYFNSIEDVPTHAITMGIASIMESKEILLLAFGSDKADAIHQLINGPIVEQFPASILQNHPKVTIIADNEALSNISIPR